MRNVQQYIESGIIEAYVMGVASDDEVKELEDLAISYPAIRDAINDYSLELELFALANPETPDPIVKPMVMASIDYMQRLSNGEQPACPPLLHSTSSLTEYTEWLDREDMKPNPEGTGLFAKIIGFTPTVTTAIVWLHDWAPQEVHHDEYERFLIVEGTCDITIGRQVHALLPGDFLQIPLHVNHSIKVTSSYACKVVLQRVAA